MPQVTKAATPSARIRQQLGHPVVDADGHVLEPVPMFADFVREHGRGDLIESASTFRRSEQRRSLSGASADERRRQGLLPMFWASAVGEADYCATVTAPGRYYGRLAEAGIDFAVLYPSMGLALGGLTEDDHRVTLCRLYNEFMGELYRPYRDRFTMAAVIPMFNPDEAIAEMIHAKELGAKVAVIPSFVRRPLPGQTTVGAPRGTLGTGVGGWIDTYGLDSAHNYDPVWAKAIELGFPLSAHSAAMGFTDRASISNFMYNHAGHFAAAAEALAKSLFFGGVTRRFPRLRVALLEGTVAVGVRLYIDLIARWRKRGAHVIDRLNPANIDRELLMKLLAASDPRFARYSADDLIGHYASPEERRDDFADAGIGSEEDIRDRFCPNFYWGCEADDPLVGLAFDARVAPLGARVPAMMGSDIGHWDVPEFDSPLAEAYELVEHGILDVDSFRDFVFANPVRCYGGSNPRFFEGTVVEDETASVLMG
jgi:predicted TIM-barrel fold metal-dependent hydrolase